jgi:hypothetical protein
LNTEILFKKPFMSKKNANSYQKIDGARGIKDLSSNRVLVLERSIRDALKGLSEQGHK